MKFDRLIAVLPCQSLEDLDLQQQEEDAEQLLSAWSALWHPALLASAQSIPSWVFPDTPPTEIPDSLVIMPGCCEPLLSGWWFTQAEAAGTLVLRNLHHRNEMVTAALERLDPDPAAMDPEIVADFLALGYCHFLVELLTRRLQYTSNLDQDSLQTETLAAAGEALGGDSAAARQRLQSAFDRLHEAREYFHPVDARLLDLTLVAPTTLGESLCAELADKQPRNLLVSGDTIEEMARHEPETLKTLKQALAAGTASLLGGEPTEIPLPLLGPEEIGQHLSRGLAAYERHLSCRPTVFGRRRFGLTPVLPQILERLGFVGAYHCTLDDGRFPTSDRSRIRWEGLDGTAIEALGSLPLDAGRAESFLQIAETLSDTLSLDYTSTVVLAHWPGKASPWYDDLRRIATYGSVVGEFVTINDYFEQTGYAGLDCHHNPDDYRSPYLSQDAAARDPISRWVRYFRRRAMLDAGDTLRVLTAMLGTSKPSEDANDPLVAAVEDAIEADEDDHTALDGRLADWQKTSLADFTQSITGAAASTQRGCLVVNPRGFAGQACLCPSSAVSRPTLVEVPAMGFAWIDPDTPEPSRMLEQRGRSGTRRTKEPPPLAEQNVLRNEFCEIRFDPHTGAIRSLVDYHSRDPRLAQQIALRIPHGGAPGDETNYTIMAADEIVATSAGPVLGEMVCRGRLMDREGRRVAGYQQTTRLWRGSRVAEIQIELDVDHPPGTRPWDSYYAVRFAWKNEAVNLYRGVSLASVPTEQTRIESPHFIDLRRDKQRTTLLCGGLPYHRRFGLRKLDTLLVVHGETARSFRLGIGVDVPNPTAAALGFVAPPLVLPEAPPPPSPTGWLFHLNCRNVLATRWEPLPDDGKMGFRVRLLETDGRGVRLGLRCYRAVASARKVNLDDVPSVDLEVENDRVSVPIGPHRWIDVEVRFA